jgi:hypothetical protein
MINDFELMIVVTSEDVIPRGTVLQAKSLP